MKLPVLLAIAFFSRTCLADDPLPSPLSGLWQMLFGLAVVLGLLAGSVWLLKRFASPMRGSGLLRILGITALGPREKIVLIEAGNKVFMLGVTPNHVCTLHVFEHDELSSPDPDKGPSSFANRLSQALKGLHHEG